MFGPVSGAHFNPVVSLVGGVVGIAVIRVLYLDLTSDEAAEVMVPHSSREPKTRL